MPRIELSAESKTFQKVNGEMLMGYRDINLKCLSVSQLYETLHLPH